MKNLGSRDLFLVRACVLSVLFIGVTFVLVSSQLRAEAANDQKYFISSKETQDEEGNVISRESRIIQSSGNTDEFINGQPVSEIKKGDGRPEIADELPEKNGLKRYILQLSTLSLGERNFALMRSGVPASERAIQVRAFKSAIALEHQNAKSAIERAIGKKLGTGKSDQDNRRIFFEYDTALNGMALELSPKEASQVRQLPYVKEVFDDTEVHASLDSSVPMINANEAWPLIGPNGASLTGYGVAVGVIDTGVDYSHQDLGGCFGPGCKVAGGWDFYNNDADPMDDHGHGTHVAATVAGKGLLADGSKLYGVAPDATLYAYKVLSSGGSGSSSTVVAAINRCVDPNQDGDLSDHLGVCTMSLGGSGNPDDPGSLASDNAMNNGVVITIAAGNSGPASQTVQSPGTSRLAITVGAACKPADVGVDSRCSSNIASFSSRGPVVWTDANGMQQTMVKPDIVAPGVNVCAAEFGSWLNGSRCKDDKHISISGTSMATPHVAGLAALLKQAMVQATPSDIKNAIKNGSVAYSGLDENIQGKGLVQTINSLKIFSPNLDFSAKLYATPFNWDFKIDVSQQTTTQSKTFTITNATESSVTVDLVAENVPSGMTVALDQSSLTIPGNNGARQVTATINADTSVLTGGLMYQPSIAVTSSVRNFYIVISAYMGNKIKASPTTLDFGLDMPNFVGTWTSTQTLSLLNLQNFSGNYTLSTDCCYNAAGAKVSGISLGLSPESVLLIGNATSAVSATMSVNNSTVANDLYSGAILVSSASQSPLRVPFRVAKFYRLTLNFPLDNKPYIVGFHDQGRTYDQQHVVGSAETSVVYFLKSAPSVLDAWGEWPIYGGGVSVPVMKFVVNEDLGFNGDQSVYLDPAMAVNQLIFSYTGINGEKLPRLDQQSVALLFKTTGSLHFLHSLGGFPPLTVATNNISSDYALSVTAQYRYYAATPTEVRKGIQYEYVHDTGIYSSMVFSNTSSDLVHTPVFGNSVVQDSTTYIGLPDCRGVGSVITTCLGFFGSYGDMIRANGFRYDLYSFPTKVVSSYAMIARYIKLWGAQGFSGPERSHTPYKAFSSSGWQNIYPVVLQVNPYRVDIGLMPYHFNVKWQILPTSDTVSSLGKVRHYAVDQEWNSTGADFYSDFTPLRYRVFRDGSILGDYAVTGSNLQVINLTSLIGTNAGNYDIELYSPVVINGTATTQSFKGSFNIPGSGFTSCVDRQPPTTTDFSFMSGDVASQLVDESRANQIKFSLDPQPVSASCASPDSIASLEVSMSTDISESQILAHSQNPVTYEYSVDVPVIAGARLYSFAIVAQDAQGNTLTYSFQLPSGNAPVPLPDTTSPTASITSPVSGSTVSGTVTVAVSASDNVGVQKVELYVDGSLYAVDSASPYTYSWDTLGYSNATHILTAKAYDLAGNIGTATPVGVTVYNQPPDTTAPLAAITDPAEGRTVSNTVTIIVDASDDVGVTRVEFYIDDNLAGTDIASPYTYSWDTLNYSNDPHILISKAYDAAGNMGMSVPVSVTVYNAPDSVAPVVSISAPAEGATVSGKVTISASATDNKGVVKMQLYIDGKLMATSASSTLRYAWNTKPKQIAAGSHVITVNASDAVGNVGFKEIKVTVRK